MKRSVKMLLLLCVLGLCLGGYYGAQLLSQPAAVTEETGRFALTARAAEELTGLNWTANDAAFAFTYSDGAWSKADEPAFPVDQDAVQAFADALIGLTAVRQLDGIAALADYGLETPSFAVTATWKDGAATTYAVGDETPFSDGWYLSLSDQNSIAYVIEDDLADDFDVTRTALATMEVLPTAETVTRITVGAAFDAAYTETSTTINAAQHWYSADGLPLDGVEELVADAQGIAWEALVEPAASDLAAYGLDSATVLTLYNGDEAAFCLHIGSTDENGDYYARLPGSGMVYTVASSSLSSLLNATAESLRSDALVETAYADLAQATFIAGERSYTLTPVIPAGDAEETAEDPGETLWDALTAITARTGAIQRDPGETLLTVQIITAAGPEATLTISAYDADSYVASLDGFAALVSSDQADKALRVLKGME